MVGRRIHGDLRLFRQQRDSRARPQLHRDQQPRLDPLSQSEAAQPAIERARSEEHTSELQSLMRISYAVFCLKKKIKRRTITKTYLIHNPQTRLIENYRHTQDIH